MAVYIKAATQEMVEVTPANGKRFKLEELQKFVGGYIEPVYLNDGRIMWVNEEGRLDGLPFNAIAYDMTRRMTRLDPGNIIVGDVLVATRAETGDEEEDDDDQDD